MGKGFSHGRRGFGGRWSLSRHDVDFCGEFVKVVTTLEEDACYDLPVRWQDQIVHAHQTKLKAGPVEETEAWKTYQRQLEEEKKRSG